MLTHELLTFKRVPHLGYGNRVLLGHGEARARIAHLSGGVAEGDVGGVVAGLQDEDAVKVLVAIDK